MSKIHKKGWEIRNFLIRKGWKTPNTYSRHYDEIPEKSGCYLFIMIGFGHDNYEMERVLYAGKSINLKQRHTSHEVHREIGRVICEMEDVIIQTWFLELSEEIIDEFEVDLIKKYSPPFNLQHRKKEL